MIISAATLNTTHIGKIFFDGSIQATGSAEILGLVIITAFIALVYMQNFGKGTTMFLGTMLLFGLKDAGMISEAFFFLALIIVSFYVAKAYSNFGRKSNA